MNLFLVAIGGALGAVARYGAVQLVMRLHAHPFPLGTMLVNILGALLIGIALSSLQHDAIKLLLVTGVLGGFTTFSAFSWDAVQLLQHGAYVQAALYIAGSVVLCLGATILGMKLTGIAA